jgi:hypothetical protein
VPSAIGSSRTMKMITTKKKTNMMRLRRSGYKKNIVRRRRNGELRRRLYDYRLSKEVLIIVVHLHLLQLIVNNPSLNYRQWVSPNLRQPKPTIHFLLKVLLQWMIS